MGKLSACVIRTYTNNDCMKYEIEIPRDYKLLFDQYLLAFEHASETKGKERHYNGESFEKQSICQINRDVGLGFGLGQIIKKSKEVRKLPPDRAIFELCGIINYAAGLMIVLDELCKRDDKVVYNLNYDFKS